ncbi:hypothetical protein WISP_14331 [Willisornis vidua]|uniref:IF rod domain-containing protein n=1 Tax=Willisornis vidua TaxID=1566151 RepID=A0ABQ9DW26_9PASS|nr:hypothetical protein WISP_14331 [Willisornis vidua]
MGIGSSSRCSKLGEFGGDLEVESGLGWNLGSSSGFSRQWEFGGDLEVEFGGDLEVECGLGRSWSKGGVGICLWSSTSGMEEEEEQEKVQDLEQQNKVLTTRWNFLKDQDNSQSDSDIRAIYEQYMGRMGQEMKVLSFEQENLEQELEKVLNTMDTFRSKYEDEIRLCSGMEFTFMELKKVSGKGMAHLDGPHRALGGAQESLEMVQTPNPGPTPGLGG